MVPQVVAHVHLLNLAVLGKLIENVLIEIFEGDGGRVSGCCPWRTVPNKSHWPRQGSATKMPTGEVLDHELRVHGNREPVRPPLGVQCRMLVHVGQQDGR